MEPIPWNNTENPYKSTCIGSMKGCFLADEFHIAGPLEEYSIDVWQNSSTYPINGTMKSNFDIVKEKKIIYYI